jgi:ankyrin repeat protein
MTENRFSPEQLREFVIAGHWSLPKVQEILAEFPEILNVPHQWAENDWETAIQAAAHAGSPHVADFLLAKGAPLEICTAAMLGRRDDVERLLADDPQRIQERGAHGITLMSHVALSGNVPLARMLFERGAHEDMSMALGNAVTKGHLEMARWIIENGNPDLTWTNYEGKTLLTLATENEALTALLKQSGK